MARESTTITKFYAYKIFLYPVFLQLSFLGRGYDLPFDRRGPYPLRCGEGLCEEGSSNGPCHTGYSLRTGVYD